jgi:hypothetical protein
MASRVTDDDDDDEQTKRAKKTVDLLLAGIP